MRKEGFGEKTPLAPFSGVGYRKKRKGRHIETPAEKRRSNKLSKNRRLTEYGADKKDTPSV
jgi:hypothetical protein